MIWTALRITIPAACAALIIIGCLLWPQKNRDSEQLTTLPPQPITVPVQLHLPEPPVEKTKPETEPRPPHQTTIKEQNQANRKSTKRSPEPPSNTKAIAHKGIKGNQNGVSGGSETGFPEFWCSSTDRLLISLYHIGIRELMILGDDGTKVLGKLPFDADGTIGVNNVGLQPATPSDGFPRLLSVEEEEAAGLRYVLSKMGPQYQNSKFGFLLPKTVVKSKLNAYLGQKGLLEKEIVSFECRYNQQGFQVVSAQTKSGGKL